MQPAVDKFVKVKLYAFGINHFHKTNYFYILDIIIRWRANQKSTVMKNRKLKLKQKKQKH